MRLPALLLSIVLFLVSCAKNPATSATGPRATVSLRDGSSYTGRVTSSTPTQITLLGDDNQTRMLNMPNVKSIEYWDAPVAQAQPQPDPTHPEHYHPDQSAIQTKTY